MNTQLIDASGTRMTIECRPSDVRIRLEARNGHEVLFYATGTDVSRLYDFLGQLRPQSPNAIEFSFEHRKVGVPEGYEIAALPLTAPVTPDTKMEKLKEALELHMQWIGPPPTDKDSYDSLREEAWAKGKAALYYCSTDS